MQSINSGFQALKMLIPNGEGEKLSKVRKYNLLELLKSGNDKSLSIRFHFGNVSKGSVFLNF